MGTDKGMCDRMTPTRASQHGHSIEWVMFVYCTCDTVRQYISYAVRASYVDGSSSGLQSTVAIDRRVLYISWLSRIVYFSMQWPPDRLDQKPSKIFSNRI